MKNLLILFGVLIALGVQECSGWYTTGQPSCQYNCGWHIGSCSCSSYCEYYGNCCDDFNDYCSTSTTLSVAGITSAPDSSTGWIEETSAGPSCLYNCGYHLGSCSCRSSCQYYGNCCHDFNDYCSTSTIEPTTAREQTTTLVEYTSTQEETTSSVEYTSTQEETTSSVDYTSAPTEPCGGSVFGSGIISSPNHPNHYNDNAYCVWTIRAEYDQRVFLAFRYLELQNCCDCDYIKVYDGSYVSSSNLLGTVCQNNTLPTFYSTSSYMTVVFRSDSSVIARGFKAHVTSALKPTSGQVNCTSDTMTIVIQRSYLNSLDYSSNDLYVNDETCRPTVSTSQVVFSFPIESCGTVKLLNSDRVVYTNGLRASNSDSGEITRHGFLKINVTCIMDQDSLSENMFVIHHPGNSTIIGTGRFNTTMTFYTSSSFNYPVTDFPYVVELNKYIYVEVDLQSSDNNLVIFLDTCVASPSPHDFHTRIYYLVRNGCTQDSTYFAYTSGTQKYARFRVKSFEFLRATEAVFLQCKVLICRAADNNSRCRRGCTRRRARDLGSDHDSQTVVLGPIKLKG